MELRYLFIGHGGISKSYIKAIAAQEGASIVGVVGRSLDRVAQYASEHHIPHYGTSIEEVAAQSHANVALICTPNAIHYDGVMSASRLGLHCLVEKPLHIDPQKQEEMLASCQKYGVKMAVSYMRRFTPHLQWLKQLIDSGSLGKILCMDVTIKHYRAPEYYESWHGTKDIDGGGPFIQQGSHIVDLALWLGHGYKTVIQATRFQLQHAIEVEDHGYAVVQFGNGAIGQITASTACTGASYERIEISTSLGTLIVDFEGIIQSTIPNLTIPSFDADTSHEALIKELVKDFGTSLELDRKPYVTGESAKIATCLIYDIYEKAGEPIPLHT